MNLYEYCSYRSTNVPRRKLVYSHWAPIGACDERKLIKPSRSMWRPLDSIYSCQVFEGIDEQRAELRVAQSTRHLFFSCGLPPSEDSKLRSVAADWRWTKVAMDLIWMDSTVEDIAVIIKGELQTVFKFKSFKLIALYKKSIIITTNLVSDKAADRRSTSPFMVLPLRRLNSLSKFCQFFSTTLKSSRKKLIMLARCTNDITVIEQC